MFLVSIGFLEVLVMEQRMGFSVPLDGSLLSSIALTESFKMPEFIE